MTDAIRFSLADLADRFGVSVIGDSSKIVSGVASIQDAEEHQVCFLASPSYRTYLADTKAGCVIISSGMAAECSSNALVCDDPYLTFAKVSSLFDSKRHFSAGVNPQAVVSDRAVVGDSVNIGACVVVEDGVSIGLNTSIGAGCYLGHGVQIGNDCKIMANVTLQTGTVIGDNCIIHSGVVIGADGFGFARQDDGWFKIPQIAGVKIGNDVEIGANTCIDCGALQDTVIGNGVKLDNLIQIAHGVSIGDNTAMAGGTSVGGSTKIGSGCTIAGMVGIVSHVEIATNVHITAMSLVTKSITCSGIFSGIPAIEGIKWRKNNARINKLEGVIKRIRQLELGKK